MFKELQITCPVSSNKVNENVARITSFFTIVFTLLSLFTGNPLFVTLLAADFAIRAFTLKGNSPVRILSRTIWKYFRIKEKLTDAAPKRFAAGLGFLFCNAISLFLIMQLNYAAYYSAGIILLCAFLEGAFSFCLGCITYTYLILPFRRKIKIEN